MTCVGITNLAANFDFNSQVVGPLKGQIRRFSVHAGRPYFLKLQGWVNGSKLITLEAFLNFLTMLFYSKVLLRLETGIDNLILNTRLIN